VSDHSATIQIRPDQLRAVAGSVSRCAGDVSGAARILRATADLSAVTPVGPALTDLRTGWSELLAIVAEDSARCGLAVLAAADAWEARETGLARAMARSGGWAPA
jgi:hypothetical protein